MSETEVALFTGSIAERLDASANDFDGVLTSGTAVARAVSHNYALLAKAYEASLAEAKVRIESGGLLPDVIAESSYYRRDRPALSRSSLSNTFSRSSEVSNIGQSIALSFSILDFGLSFVRTLQAADRLHQSVEDVRRVEARIREQTRAAYWRAVALDTLVPKLKPVDARIDGALANARQAIVDPLLDPIDSINFQRNTLNTRREINDLFASLAGAEHELRNLIAVPSHRPLRLDHKRSLDDLSLPQARAQDDISLALRQRPEIRQHMYDLRISEKEVYAAFLQVLPGVTLDNTSSSDSNSFLFHASWVSWGSRIVANLIEAVRLPAKLNDIEMQKEVDRQHALATAATIVMQVQVARAQTAVHLRAYRDAHRSWMAQRELLQQIRNSVLSGTAAEQAIAQEEADVLLAELRAIIAFGDLHAALAAYEAAIGMDSPAQSNTHVTAAARD